MGFVRHFGQYVEVIKFKEKKKEKNLGIEG